MAKGMTLEDKYVKEQEKLAKLQEKRNEIDEEIKKSEKTLKAYKVQIDNEMYQKLLKATEGTGISVSDIIGAFQSGDLLGLQELMETTKGSLEAVTG